MLLENDEDDSRQQRGTREHHHSQRGEQAARPKTKKKVVNAFNIVLFFKKTFLACLFQRIVKAKAKKMPAAERELFDTNFW